MLHIGLENYIPEERVISILKPTTTVWKMVRAAEEAGKVINATYRRPVRSVILMDGGKIVLSILDPQAIRKRVAGQEG